jgi:hypothetical protein
MWRRCAHAWPKRHAVLGGFELGTDATIVRYPDRYADKRGTRMWDEVTSLIEQIIIAKKEAV